VSKLHKTRKWVVLVLAMAVWKERVEAIVISGVDPSSYYGKNGAQVVAFCGTYMREWGFCGNIPQNSMLMKELVTLDDFEAPAYQRTPYGIFTNYGALKKSAASAPLTRTLWFEDDEGNLRNVNADLNPSAMDMFIRRKGKVDVELR
jgi:hypothetical protein